MAYDFKNLNEVPIQDEPTENTTVMAFENGVPKQIPASEFGGKGLVVDLCAYPINTDSETIISDISYDPIYEAVMTGQNVVFRFPVDGTVAFYQYTLAGIFEEFGFIVCLLTPGGGDGIWLVFTNGSYHTTA